MKISEFIPIGRVNAISNDDLAIVIGTDKRNARRLVYQARVNGEPICSTCEGRSGYYLPRNVSEACVYLRQQNARIKSARAALCGVKRYIKENGGNV